jgi:hypothetical protein
LKLATERLASDGHGNIEWLEFGLREAIQKDARMLIEGLLNDPATVVKLDYPLDGEQRYGNRLPMIGTLFGPVEVRRNYYYLAGEKEGRFPLDQALGLIEGCSPALARLMCRAGGQSPFESASADLQAYGGIDIEGRSIQRLVNRVAPSIQKGLDAEILAPDLKAVSVLYVSADGTGIPMVKRELEGHPGRQADGSAKTRETKLGCVYTQQGIDEEGWPMRDPDSTSYIASLKIAADFGGDLRKEAFRRGMAIAQQTVFIGDGAKWVWEVARVNFPGAVHILDFYHAAQHLGELCDTLYGKGSEKSKSQTTLWKACLKEDGVDEVIAGATAALPRSGPRRKEAKKQIAYFQKNRERMLYATFRTAGYFIGSGVVEAGCRTVVGLRLKQSGMFWSTPGAQNVLSLRAALLGNRFDAYWDHRNGVGVTPFAKAA